MKILLCALLASVDLFAAGIVQQTTSQLGTTGNWVVAFQWTGDVSDGSVPITVAKLGGCCAGFLITQVETVPGTPAPSANYSVAITDSAGLDFLAGAAATCSATTAQSFATPSSAPPIQGSFNLNLTGNAVAGARGTVYVFMQKPGTINVAQILRPIISSPNWLTLANAPVLDVRTCGAKGNGVFDDSTAINSCLSHSNTIVYFPPGNWNLVATGAAVGGTGITILCAGPAISTLHSANGATFAKILNVGSNGNTTIDGCGIDGNFINTSSANQQGIFSTGNNLIVRNSLIKNVAYSGAPAYNPTNYSNSAGILCTPCTNAQIYNNQFVSDWVLDIHGTGNGATVRDNRFGVPDLSQVGTNVNYWDTQSGGIGSVEWVSGSDVKIAGNKVWGNNRFYTPSFAVGGPIVTYFLTRADISNNDLNHMTGVPGTCSVANASASVTCTRPIFDSALDVNMGIECETAVGSIFPILTVNSTTNVTLTTGYTGSTLTTARCRMQISGDAIQNNGIQNSRIANNSSFRSSDQGIDILMYWSGNPADNVPSFANTVTGNFVSYAANCGINLSLGQVQDITLTGNVLLNNHQGTDNAAGARGAFCMVASPDNTHFYPQTGLNFTGNSAYDSQGPPTQLYFVDVDVSSYLGGWFGFLMFTGNTMAGTPNFSNEPLGQDNPLSTAAPGGVAYGSIFSNTSDNANLTAGAQTYTAAQMVGSPAILRRDPGGLGATDITPTAAQIVARVGQNLSIIGTGWDFYLRNVSGGATTITLTGGTNVTLIGTLTVAQNQQRQFHCYIADPSVPSVTCYSMGSGSF